MKFMGKVTRMGRKRMINIPSKQKGFDIGNSVEVKDKGNKELEKQK